ncbi:MAG: DUF2225 domain-containing protein [Lachnospiraceae bacterium]|nr:DUF2225 domain-containing protein [Lachnospiraceae bacterium]
MKSLLSRLSSLGLGDLQDTDIYEDEKAAKKAAEKKQPPKKIQVQEKNLIFEKNFDCPVCHADFTNKVLMTGKARLIGMDRDLRPLHDVVDTQKYDVIMCPHCGYAGLKRFFPYVTDGQRKLVREHICEKIQLNEYDGDTYSYEECVERYQIALACAVVKHGRASEKAYICLKTAWLLRGYVEEIAINSDGISDFAKELQEQEEEYLRSAYTGFLEARQSENFPMCGMDEHTIDYLLAALATHFGEYDTAGKLVSKIITSKTANTRTKDKARDLRDDILRGLKKDKE